MVFPNRQLWGFTLLISLNKHLIFQIQQLTLKLFQARFDIGDITANTIETSREVLMSFYETVTQLANTLQKKLD
jgi:glycopeptide antibiotics resistance protein